MASDVCISGEYCIIFGKTISDKNIIMHYTFEKLTHCLQYYDGLRSLLNDTILFSLY